MAEPQPIIHCATCGTKVEHRQAFGEVRPVCPACGRVHFVDPKVASGVIVTRGGSILLVRRAVEPESGKWSIPAGFVEADEDPRHTAERECLEETGLQVKTGELLDVIHGREHASGASIVIIYQATILGGELGAADDADAVDFFSPENLPPMAFKATRLAIERWRGHQVRG